MAVSAVVTLVATVMTTITMVMALPGKYISNSMMDNQRLPNPVGVFTPVFERKLCEEQCSKHATCDAYSYSNFQKICQIYKSIVGTKAIIQNNYKLYVLEKSQDDGFHKYGTDYIKLFADDLKNAVDAQDTCSAQGGFLVEIKDQGLQYILSNIMLTRSVFDAYIGITDNMSEGEWKYISDISDIKFDNWNWRGVWARGDLNCAIMKVDGTWKHTHCGNKFYFFCQIPMF